MLLVTCSTHTFCNVRTILVVPSLIPAYLTLRFFFFFVCLCFFRRFFRPQALSLLGRLCSGVTTERETQAYMEQRGLRGFLAGCVLLEVRQVVSWRSTPATRRV